MDIPKNTPIYTVSELNRLIRHDLEDSFSDIWLEGEISNFFCHNSRHMYFDLKDEDSRIRVVMFYRDNCRLVFDMEEGLHIQVNGYVSVYEKRGEYQVIARDARPVGKGALILAFEQLKERLLKKGFFDSRHKKKIPMLPQCIGVATSISGAVLRDIVSVLEKRFPGFHLVVRNVNVGGITSAPELCQAVRDLDSYGVDVIIVARGGGSLEDLWGFNSEELACAIYECSTPVISAVGHQTDITISDLVADLRAATPSVAAEKVILDREKTAGDIDRLRAVIKERTSVKTGNYRRQVRLLIDRRYFRRPLVVLEPGFRDTVLSRKALEEAVSGVREKKKNILVRRASRLSAQRIRSRVRTGRLVLRNSNIRWMRSIPSYLDNRKKRTAYIMESLEKNNPVNIIKRGFAAVYDAAREKSISNVGQTSPGERIEIRLRDGRLIARVLEKIKSRMIEVR